MYCGRIPFQKLVWACFSWHLDLQRRQDLRCVKVAHILLILQPGLEGTMGTDKWFRISAFLVANWIVTLIRIDWAGRIRDSRQSEWWKFWAWEKSSRGQPRNAVKSSENFGKWPRHELRAIKLSIQNGYWFISNSSANDQPSWAAGHSEPPKELRKSLKNGWFIDPASLKIERKFTKSLFFPSVLHAQIITRFCLA